MNIALCDDNKIQLNNLLDEIKNICPFSATFTCFSDAEALANNIQECRIDLVFLDIMLKGSNGIDWAKRLLAIKPDIIIVFVSACVDFYEDVYDVEHIFFLTKPVKEDKLQKALLLAYNKYCKIIDKYITIKTKGTIQSIDLTRVLAFESKKRGSVIHMEDGDLPLTTVKLEELFELIPRCYKDSFYRCHKSFIINLNRVVKISCGFVYMDNSLSVPISRKYKNEAAEKIALAIGGFI